MVAELRNMLKENRNVFLLTDFSSCAGFSLHTTKNRSESALTKHCVRTCID